MAGNDPSGEIAMGHDDMGPAPDKTSPDTIADKPTKHAFVTLGTKTLFLCHLTMYGPDPEMEPHMYQLVLEATLPAWAEKIYRSERCKHPNDTYFLGNSPLDLLTVPELNSRCRTWFLADVFRGIPYQTKYESWPWEKQEPLIASARVEIRRIVHYRPFALNMNYPKTLTYLLFGAGDEAHMTNWQTREPDFDHVLDLAAVPAWVGERELEAGILIEIPDLPRPPDGGDVPCANPLPSPGNSCSVRYRGSDPRRSIKVGQTYWFCTRVANATNPCPDSTTPCASAPPAP